MGNFLDLRTSVNSSFYGSPNIPLEQFQILGDIGLQTANVPNPIVALMANYSFELEYGTGGAVFEFTGVLTREMPSTPEVYILIQRNYYVSSSSLTSQIVTIPYLANDLNAPAAAQIQYLFSMELAIFGSGNVTRVGPESFMGIAQNGAVPPTP